jgi:endonuclease/exonuclease/phosphatase family metal-dependent hydrolase
MEFMRYFKALVLVLAVPFSVASEEPQAASTSAHRLFEAAVDDELLLLNGNTWLVPVYAPDHRQRLLAIAEYVHALPVLPHVITFQEVWRAKRVKEVRELFPEYTAFTSGNFRNVAGMRFNESGLVTLVRFDVEVAEVEYTLIDCEMLVRYNRLVSKGSLATSVVHAGHLYRIANVHLPHTMDGRFLGLTEASLRFLNIDGIVAGDLNLEPHRLPPEYVVADHTPTFGNDSLGRERVRRIDYVLGDATTIAETIVVTDSEGRCLPFSDHCFLAARLQPKRTAGVVYVAQNLRPAD